MWFVLYQPSHAGDFGPLEVTREDGEQPEYRRLLRRKQLVAPVQSCPKRPMPGRRGFVVAAKLAEPTADGIEEFRGRELSELRGCDLDRERKAVQRCAEARDNGGVTISQ